MAENKKSIVEEAMLDIKAIQEALTANTREILHSVAIGEIDSVVKESINEDMYDEEDVDDTDEVSVDVDAEDDGDINLDVTDEPEVPAAPVVDTDNEIGGLELGAGEGIDLEAGEESEDFDFDLTGATDEDVISVYKKLANDDEIEVISPNEVIIKDPTSGAEYNVKLGSGGETTPEAGLDLGLGDDIAPEVELEPMILPAPVAEPENPEVDVDITDDSEEDDELGESVVFEIALGDDEDVIDEDIIRGKGHDTHLKNTTMDSGNIEGTKADKDTDSGDNLTGGFDDDAVKHAKAEGPMVMGENDEVEMEVEELDEAIPVGNAEGRRVPGVATPIKGPGAKSLEEANTRYNALLSEAKKLKSQNEEFKTSLKKFRQMLGETVVFNSNLTYVTKLFLEHSTTGPEKKSILNRFDNEVTTLVESKKLYKVIANELTNKPSLRESVENKIVKEGNTSVSGQLNENTAYVHPETKRIQDLMYRVENR